MTNPYYVQALSGLNPGDELQELLDRRELKKKEQLQTEQQEQFGKLLKDAYLTGDQNKIADVFSMNPELGLKLEEREREKAARIGLEKMQASRQAELDWGLKWKQATTEEQKEKLKQEALSDPLIDIDDDDIAISGKAADLAVDAMLYGHLGKDGFKAVIGNRGDNNLTEYQRLTIEGQNADREVRKLEAENKRIDNQLQREINEVKLEDLRNKKAANIDKQNQLLKGRSDAAQSVVDSGESTLELINQIRKHPGFESAIGFKGASSIFGLIDEPFAGSDAAGVKALVDTLDAQNFLTAIGEFKAAGGAGSLSDNEGKKLGAALSNLSRAQSEKDFKTSLNVIESLVKKQVSKAKPQVDRKLSPEVKQQNATTGQLTEEQYRQLPVGAEYEYNGVKYIKGQ